MLTGCQKDRKTCQQTVGQIDRKTDSKTERLFRLVVNVKRMPRKIERQNVFSAYLSKQALFIMSTECLKDRMPTGCQKVGQTDRKIDRAPGRQTKQQIKRENYIETDRMTLWQKDSMQYNRL